MNNSWRDDAIQDIDLSNLPSDEELEGPLPDKEFLDSVNNFGVIYPVILCNTDDEIVVIDGRRRIKAARRLQHETIPAIEYYGLDPTDRSAWAIILNEQRSDNIISEYLYYSQLVKEGDWDEIRKDYGFNKAHVDKVLTLGNIKRLDLFKKAYETGNVSKSTLYSVAKLSEKRQKEAAELLIVNGKLTGKDIKDVKQTQLKEAVSTMPSFDIAVPVGEPLPAGELFAVISGSANMALVFDDALKAIEEKNSMPGSKLYKLVEV